MEENFAFICCNLLCYKHFMNPLPRILGYFGVVPFLILAALSFLFPDPAAHNVLAFTHVTYGALIASFLGGIHWPFALQRDMQVQIALSVMPVIIGLAMMIVAFVVSDVAGLLGMGALFALIYLVDKSFLPDGAFHPDYQGLRRNLTVLVIGSYAAALLARFLVMA